MALTSCEAYRLPLPASMKNHKNYIISLANLCRWLSWYAEKLSVEIYSGFSACKCLFDDKNQVIGIETKAMGLDKQKNQSVNYEPSIQISACHPFWLRGVEDL